MKKIAQITEHKKPWSQSARLLLAEAKALVESLNTPFPFEAEPPAPYWPQVFQTMQAAATAVTSRPKAGIYTTYFEVVFEEGHVRCYTAPQEKERELFFEIGPIEPKTN